MSLLLILIVSILLVLVAYVPCRYQSSIIDQISEKADSHFRTVLAQRKDIEGHLQQIKSLEEHCVAQKKVVDEYYAKFKELHEKASDLENKAREIQEGYLSEVKRNNAIKTDLKLARETIRKLNRRAQKAESELIKSQKYHKNTKTYFKDRLEWSLDALQDARNLVTQLGNKIDWHLKTCNPFEKKEAGKWEKVAIIRQEGDSMVMHKETKR